MPRTGRPSTATGGYWRSVFGTRPTRIPAVVVPDLRAVLSAVAASAGVTVLPYCLCASELATGSLVPLREPEVPPLNTRFLACRADPVNIPSVTAVHTHLLDSARDE
ncbi:LysR substrate-binding domain-containing protein [Streptomyces sp. NPDC058657]|uniref:LysR substrate-binding domain-containing protein n=1 Tax=unclassified Streptomyces TaxID=2593676 RepID=UPI003651D325